MDTIDRIKRLAKEKGIKMRFLTDSLGLNASYFSNVASGKTGISEERLSTIANLLGTTSDYLAGRTHFPYPKSFPHYDKNRRDYDAGIEEMHRELAKQMAPKFNFDRYDDLRKARGLLPNYVERIIGVPYDSMTDVWNGDQTLTDEQITKLAILLNTTYDYLMGLTDNPEIPLNDRTGVKIKVFGEVAAGIPIAQIDNFDPADPASWEEIDRGTARNGSYFGLRLKGDSMEPRMYSGDVVIVRQQASVDSGDIAVVAINGDTATCKKVVYDENGGMFLVSLNSKYPPKYFNRDQILNFPVTIMGKVVELRSKF